MVVLVVPENDMDMDDEDLAMANAGSNQNPDTARLYDDLSRDMDAGQVAQPGQLNASLGNDPSDR